MHDGRFSLTMKAASCFALQAPHVFHDDGCVFPTIDSEIASVVE